MDILMLESTWKLMLLLSKQAETYIIYINIIKRRAIVHAPAFAMWAGEAYARACFQLGFQLDQGILDALTQHGLLMLDLRLCPPAALSTTCSTLREKPTGIRQILLRLIDRIFIYFLEYFLYVCYYFCLHSLQRYIVGFTRFPTMSHALQFQREDCLARWHAMLLPGFGLPETRCSQGQAVREVCLEHFPPPHVDDCLVGLPLS